MKKVRFMIWLIIVLAISFQCKNDVAPNPDTLCTYYKERSVTNIPVSENECDTNTFILHLEKRNAKVEYLSDINKYAIIFSINGTYDCQIIGILCEDYPNLSGKSIIFSGDVNEYYGNYQAPIGGQKIFVVKNFEYII